MSVIFAANPTAELKAAASDIQIAIANYIALEKAQGSEQNDAVKNSLCTIIGIYGSSGLRRKEFLELVRNAYEVEFLKPVKTELSTEGKTPPMDEGKNTTF